jgi:hypothetical protein
MALGDGSEQLEFGDGGLYPTCRSKRPMVGLAEAVSGTDVVVENAAVIYHACDELDFVTDGRGEDQIARPWLQGAQNDHGPVDKGTEAFETLDQV